MNELLKDFFKNDLVKSLLIAIICGAIGFLSFKIIGADNPIEQSMESVIKKETNIDIDLSPNQN